MKRFLLHGRIAMKKTYLTLLLYFRVVKNGEPSSERTSERDEVTLGTHVTVTGRCHKKLM